MSSVVDPLAEVVDLESPYHGRKIRFFEHIVLAAYWFGSNFIWGAFLGPVLSSHMTKLSPQHSAPMLGILYSLGAIPALVIPLIAGPLSDRCTSRWGRRKPYILGGALLTLTGIGLLALGYNALSLPAYLGGYLVLQIGANTALGAYSGIIPDLVPPEQRGVASGYMAVMSQLSTLFGAFLSGKLLSSGGSNTMFAMLAGVFAFWVAVCLFGIKEKPLAVKPKPIDWSRYFHHLWVDPRKYPDFAWVWLTRALMMCGFYLIQPHLLYFLRDVIHVEKPETQAAYVFGIILLAATVSGYLGGHLSDKVGRKPVVIWASVEIAVMCIVFIFLRNLEQALIAGVIFGLGYGAYISVDWALGADVLPNKADAGKDMAVWHISMTLPQAVAPALSAAILNGFGVSGTGPDGKALVTYALPGYAIVFTLAGLAFLLGGVLVKKVKGAR